MEAQVGGGKRKEELVRRPVIVYWSWVFLGLALVAGVLALSGIVGTATGLSYVLFLLFFVAYLVSFFIGRRPPPIT